MPRNWSGRLQKGRLGKGWSPREKTLGVIPRTSPVMLEDKNVSWGRRTNSLRQPKTNSHLLSGQLDYIRNARG